MSYYNLKHNKDGHITFRSLFDIVILEAQFRKEVLFKVRRSVSFIKITIIIILALLIAQSAAIIYLLGK